MEKQKTFLAKISVYCSGKCGSSGEYVAEIIPQYFKNGKMKKSGFIVLKEIETIKKAYCYGNATKTETVTEIIKEI